MKMAASALPALNATHQAVYKATANPIAPHCMIVGTIRLTVSVLVMMNVSQGIA
jgi:hypothetical protein